MTGFYGPLDKGLVYDAGTGYVGYDENRTYGSYGLEAGYEWDMNESTRLDFAARYRTLTLEGFTDRIAGDRYEIDDFESHRTPLGLRLNYTGRRGIVPYIGAAWEYEFDSKVRGRAEGLELAEDSLKGSTGVGEIGIKINPSEDSRWTFDGSLKGYIGGRKAWRRRSSGATSLIETVRRKPLFSKRGQGVPIFGT